MLKKLRGLAALTAASALLLTGCSSGSPSATEDSPNTSNTNNTDTDNTDTENTNSDNEASGDLTTIRLAAVPVVDVAAAYLGEKVGIFEEHGLTLDIQFTPGSSVAIPAMMQDQYDIVYTGSVNAFQARETGLEVLAIAEGGRTTGEHGADHGGILVPESSDIQDAGDLEGRSVAVNAVKGLHEAAIRQSVKKAGGDPDLVQFLELPLPDMLPALENDRLDAISTSEPFLGNGKDAGYRLIADPYVDVDPEFVTAVYLASEQKYAEDPELIESFVQAVKESQEYATAHQDEFRTELSNFTEIDPETAQSMILTKFGWGFPEEPMRRGAEATQEAGIIQDVDKALDGLVVTELQ